MDLYYKGDSKMNKRIQALILSIAVFFSVFCATSLPYASAVDEFPFCDVPEGSWFYESVETVWKAGIMNGTSEVTFSPHDKMTRGQIVTILARLSGDDFAGAGAASGFSDVAENEYYADPVGWAVGAGITKGRSEKSFAPDAPVLRQEFAAFFVRYMKYKNITVPEENVAPFPDRCPDWAKDDIETLHKTGLVKGDEAGRFNPNNDMTRAEIAAVTARFLSFASGLSLNEYTVVYGTGAEKAAERVAWQIKTLTGADIPVVSDSSQEKDKEIVLGHSNRGAVIDTEGLGADGYEIKREGNKIFVDGETADGIYRGAAALVKSGNASGSVFSVPENPDSRVQTEYPIKTITVNGNPISDYVIVIPEDPAPSVMTGVNDLVKYIEAACGVRLGVTTVRRDRAIVVDQTKVVVEGAYNDNKESYSIRSEGDDIVISGAPEAGCMYGCYAFLKYCLGWYFLTPEIDYVRPKDSLELSDINIVYTPYFEYRINYWYAALNHPEYAAKTEQNGRSRSPDDEYGIHLACSWIGCHTLTYLYKGYYDDGPQPCLNEEETSVIDLLGEYGEDSIIDISYADGGEICECEVCRAIREEEGSESGNMIRFINRISDGLKAAGHGKAVLHTLAYTSTVTPCKTKPRDNVIVQYCTLDTCFTDPVDECPVAGHAKTLSGWGEICSRIWVWDYGIHFFNYLNPAANEKYEVLCHNIRFYLEHGVSGLVNQGFSAYARSGEFSELKQFLLTEVVHNPYLTEDEYYDLMDAFIEGYYGVDCVGAIRDYETLKAGFRDCDFWCDAPGEEIFSKCIKWRKDFGRASDDFTTAALMTDSYFGWDSVNLDRMQVDYLRISYDYSTAQRKGDAEGLRRAQTEAYELVEKMRSYNLRLDENRELPKFTGPDEITESPAYWRYILNPDGTLKTGNE